MDLTDSKMDLGYMSGEPLPSLMFEGRHAVECEDFISAVQRYTFTQGKPVDDRFVAQFASSCFTRDALRWWSNLDDEVQSSWKLLRKAMLDRYQPLFQGTSGEEAEYFVRMVSQRALDEGKHSDFTWAAAFASACLDGDALRWWSSLPPNVKNDWNILRQAILHQYPTIPKRLIPTPAAAAPPPAPLWKPTLRGRVLVTIDGDPTCYYLSKQVSPGSFTVLTSLVSLALEVGCEYGRLENAILFIPPGQLPSFDSLGIHWAGYDLASPVNFALLCAFNSKTGEGALSTCKGPLLKDTWNLHAASTGVPKSFSLNPRIGNKLLYSQANGQGFPLTFLYNPPPDKAARLFLEIL